MNSKILNTLASTIDSKEEAKRRFESGTVILDELGKCVQNCLHRFKGKAELATEDDTRIILLCEKWEKVLSHGIRTNLANSTIQNLVTAGLNFTFNIINVGNSLWSYTCLHLTKHEKERFKILSNINTPLGYFRAFLRAALNERSLERRVLRGRRVAEASRSLSAARARAAARLAERKARLEGWSELRSATYLIGRNWSAILTKNTYLQSWISHGLLMEYYEEGALVRSPEISHKLPGIASGLSTVLFALSIDRPELNDSQQQSNQINRVEHVIPLPVPIKSSNNFKRKPLRQVISFDKNEPKNQHSNQINCFPNLEPEKDTTWQSAPATCLNSPDPKIVPQVASTSEPTSSEYKSSFRHFFPDSVKGIDSPSQILTKLSECAKEIFSSSNSIDVNNTLKDDLSEVSINNLKISESDSEEVAGSINGSTSCLELCFTEDESVPDNKNLMSILENREKDFLNLQLKCNQIELGSKEKIQKLENVVMDLSKENDRLKEQLRHYMSAVEMGIALKSGTSAEKISNQDSEEVNQYERKLVQVAEMHAELMEFNQHLQHRLQELENSSGLEVLDYPQSNVKVHIPSAFLIGKKTHSYHVYQIFLKIGAEEWNVFHRYAKFYELHSQLKKCHPDIATYKFPPKKTLRKRDSHLVEQRRIALQAYLRHILLVLPELRECTSRAHLVTLLPFFGTSSVSKENGLNNLERQHSNESVSSYNAL